MPTLDVPVTSSFNQKSTVPWKRVILAAFLSEVSVLVVLSVVLLTHRFVIEPGLTADQYQQFGQRASYDVAPPAAALATFVFALWAAGNRGTRSLSTGLLVGVAATLLTIGFVFGARPEDRLMYGVSYMLRIAAGYCAGLLAQKRQLRSS